jgi:hypothetical protein
LYALKKEASYALIYLGDTFGGGVIVGFGIGIGTGISPTNVSGGERSRFGSTSEFSLLALFALLALLGLLALALALTLIFEESLLRLVELLGDLSVLISITANQNILLASAEVTLSQRLNINWSILAILVL